MGKVELNKQKKRESLLDSAFQLFTNNGFSKTFFKVFSVCPAFNTAMCTDGDCFKPFNSVNIECIPYIFQNVNSFMDFCFGLGY